MGVNITDIIAKKRDGLELSKEEIRIFINAVVNETISDAQIGAMLMAMYLKNLTYEETVSLTKAMIETGEIISFENFNKDILVDKHSTGGVGDKVSLILAPALAALGLKVPMMSGWGLNHTGGTLDKIQSIPGFQVSLSADQMKECLNKAGCFICSATETLAPADAILYKLRNITSTVDNRGLIASSILSKKAAEGIGLLVLDVKFGRGSFSETEEDARKLAEIMVKIGNKLNLITKAVISEMNVPLGRYIGNSLEVVESVMCLKNEVNNNLLELVQFLGGVILETKGLAKTVEEGKIMILESLKCGSALNCFQKMLTAQGVSEENARKLCSGSVWDVLPKASHVTQLSSSKKGVVTNIDSLCLGKACAQLGGARTKANMKIDYSAGVILLKLVGDNIERNEAWIEIHHSTDVLPLDVKNMIQSSLTVETNPNTVKKNIAINLYSQ